MWSPLELFANLFTVVCIFLAGRNNIHTWWTGIVACVLFAILFFGANLYADVTLQLFFIVTSIIGWKQWSNPSIKLPTSASPKQLVIGIILAIILAGSYGWVLHLFTNAFAPFIDSTVLAFSILGQLLLMGKYVQAWPVWVLVNILSVPLYASRGLYLTAGLYAVFLGHAIWATYNWIKLGKINEKV